MAENPPKRPRGRPPLEDGQKSVSVTAWLPVAVCDRLIRRAQREGQSVSRVLRQDLELVAAWRQRKCEGRDP